MGLARTVTRRTGRRAGNAAFNPAARCRQKFLRFFHDGFRDETYIDWERGYKEKAHRQWEELLASKSYFALLRDENFVEIAQRAVRIESRTNLLFSFEKMAFRDAVKSPAGARLFATGLYDYLYGRGRPEAKFERWCETVARLPRKQTRVLTWPIVTVFGFIAQPGQHIFLKPTVTRVAAQQYGCDFSYRLAAELANLRQPAPFWPSRPCRSQRPPSARFDRHPILHLGARLRRICRVTTEQAAMVTHRAAA